jgi:hypothetical protein
VVAILEGRIKRVVGRRLFLKSNTNQSRHKVQAVNVNYNSSSYEGHT